MDVPTTYKSIHRMAGLGGGQIKPFDNMKRAVWFGYEMYPEARVPRAWSWDSMLWVILHILGGDREANRRKLVSRGMLLKVTPVQLFPSFQCHVSH